MKLSSSISLYAGGPGSGCHGPNCGRHPVGTRVMRNPKIWKDKNPHNTGVVVSHEDGRDNKDRPVKGYRYLSDADAADLKKMKEGKYQFEEWEDPKRTMENLAKGKFYTDKELVPEKKR